MYVNLQAKGSVKYVVCLHSCRIYSPGALNSI